MPRTDHFSERIGAVFLPEADAIAINEDVTPDPDGQNPVVVSPTPGPVENLPGGPFPPPVPPFKICRTTLKQGCYSVLFTPAGAKLWGTRFRGTLRVEQLQSGIRTSGDLYSYRLLDDIVGRPGLLPIEVLQTAATANEAADTGGTIPIYRRRSYHSYLKGTGARLATFVPPGGTCSFSLDFDEFVYSHPATGFSGSFSPTANRSIRYVLRKTDNPDLYTGEAFVGSTNIGSVSIRWVSQFYRRAELQINTLAGAVTPPAAVGGSTFASIFADVGWDLTVADQGVVPLPPALAGIDINAAWSAANLHALMTSVPGYGPPELDLRWRVHLVAVPARLGSGRGVMFDSSLGADPNDVPREGSATFSHDGYPATESVHYDAAADGRQFEFPRAFLRSATHEVGHAFNQIHQNFEGGVDNSIMSPTNSVAGVIGAAGTFPDDINLAFNDRVKKHLRHLPDPAVRPGAMDFFGSAVNSPEAADVAWLETADLTIELSTATPKLGEPVQLSYQLRNAGEVPLPVPEIFDTETLTVRVNVTDPTGRITFMRPEKIDSCPHLAVARLTPGMSVNGSTTLFWGRDGFAFNTPGRHIVEVILLWDIAGVPAGAAAEREVYVAYPTSDAENDVAATLLDPQVGAAVASGSWSGFGVARERMGRVMTESGTHPAVRAIAELQLSDTTIPAEDAE